MRKLNLVVIAILTVCYLIGCSPLEVAKKIWGSSTETLEEQRVNAITKSFQCDFDECFDAVLKLERDDEVRQAYHRIQVLEGTEEEIDEEEEKELLALAQKSGHFDVFLKNRIKSHIVVMGVKGSVDTTEVGIFFVPEGGRSIRIEVSSLSSHAKQQIADVVFEELGKEFSTNY